MEKTASKLWGATDPPFLANIAFKVVQKGLTGGAIKRALRRYVARSGMFQDICIDDVKMRCHVADNSTERLLAESGGKSEKMTNVRRMTSLLAEGDVFVDVGANCGLFTLFAAKKVGIRGRVLAVEPLPILLDRLAFNVSINELPQVTIIRCAAGDENGEITIFANPDQYGKSSSTAGRGSVPIKVQVRPLHELLASENIVSVDALKIDVEGFEDRALLPLFSSSPRDAWPRHILIETAHRHRWGTDCLDHLKHRGYKVAWQDQFDALLVLDRS